MKRNNIIIGLAALLALPAMLDAQPRGPRFDENNPTVHDPVMAKEGDTFYVFGTGIQTMMSKDLKTWKPAQSPLANFEWIQESVKGFRGHSWAPDVIYKDGLWHMYYSCSAFGVNTSCIGHFTRTTLDPTSSEEWKDCGEIIRSVPGQTNWNAIDPNIYVDRHGKSWLVFGSFWDGIQLVPLKKDLSAVKGKTKTVARRYNEPHPELANPTSNHAGINAIEAPFVFQKNGWYYLFVSWDYCCRGDKSSYRVVVGRSKKPTGPFLDRDGKDMADGGGTAVAFNNEIYNASGHNSAYTFDGKDYYVSHAYEREGGQSRLIIREMNWDSEGWPIVNL